MKVLLLIFFLLPCKLYGQSQEGTVLLYNVALGGITSGVGAVINKPKEVNWKKALVRGVLQGSVGGALNYSGKKTLYLINKYENIAYAWPSKILHAAGTSIIENAAMGEPFLRNWHIDYGIVRFDFALKGKRKFKARFLPCSIPAILWAAQVSKFNLRTTLLSGNIAFTSRTPRFKVDGSDFLGISWGRAFVYTDNFASNKYEIIAHELVHQFQFNESQVVNACLTPISKKIPSKLLHQTFSEYMYFDVPYFRTLYYIEGSHGPLHYNRNYFEFEATRFSTNRTVFGL